MGMDMSLEIQIGVEIGTYEKVIDMFFEKEKRIRNKKIKSKYDPETGLLNTETVYCLKEKYNEFLKKYFVKNIFGSDYEDADHEKTVFFIFYKELEKYSQENMWETNDFFEYETGEFEEFKFKKFNEIGVSESIVRTDKKYIYSLEDLNKLSDLIKEMKEDLNKVGIDKEPKMYVVAYPSY